MNQRTIDRRSFVRRAMGVALCPICAGLLGGKALASDAKPHWTYKGAAGPADWGDLDPAFAVCRTGAQQSPIDLAHAIPTEIAAGSVKWQPASQAIILNNGHTIQVNTPDAGTFILDADPYTLAQFHFHHGSEHTLDGVKFPMEAHFVHKGADGKSLTVVGVFIVEGEANSTLTSLWAAMPEEEGEKPLKGSVDPRGLLPAAMTAYRYEGSLTTPPCSEIVNWVVLKEPITASQAQVAAFAKLFPDNARPVQALNRRFILSTQ